MATWQTDVLGTGLAHAEPTRQQRLLARRIAWRWKMWQPLLLHELRQRPHPPGYVAREMLRLERAHAQAVTRLLDQGVSWRRVRGPNRLDDPRLTDDDRAFRLANRRFLLRKSKPKVRMTPEQRRARRAECARIRQAAWDASNEASRLARGLTPDKSVARFIRERFREDFADVS